MKQKIDVFFCFFIVFLFCWSPGISTNRLLRLPQVSLRHLRRRDRRISLDVVDVEVLLEVEVRELVLRLEVEELEESRITLDVVLVLEVLLLHVRRDELRDV